MDTLKADIGMIEGAAKQNATLGALPQAECHEVNFYTAEPRKLVKAANLDRFIHITGSLECRAVLPPKMTISDACEVLKKDAATSLRHRLELLGDE